HPIYPEVAFLETAEPLSEAASVPRQIDLELREFFLLPDWHARSTELRHLLGSDPSWTAAPVLEVVDRVMGGWFRLRFRNQVQRNELVHLLQILRSRPGPDPAERARTLLRHWDPEVCELARQLAG